MDIEKVYVIHTQTFKSFFDSGLVLIFARPELRGEEYVLTFHP
jgi:hypothetical protein